jgi:hypothetical protein
LGSAATAIAFSLLFVASPAAADCNSDTALFADDFEFMDISWGDPDNNFFVEDGALVVKGGRQQVNFQTKNEGANFCADVTIVEAPAPDNSPAGLIFWWQDWDNYYYLYYWVDGTLDVRRVVKGKENTLFETNTLALKKGLRQTNHIELDLKPKDATILINGTEVKRFKGVQPKDGGVVGVTTNSPDDKPGKFTFDNFIVSPAE